MKNRLLVSTITAVVSLGFLSACGVDNNRMNDTENVNYSPVRYDRYDDGNSNRARGNNMNNNVNPTRYRTDNNNLNIDANRNNRLNENNEWFGTDNDGVFDDDRNNRNILPGTNGSMTGR
ncbi:hypothetical protein J2Z40_000037 [Cytobacillus eiseniae]|uniref:Lipoprotein n=1 Tax=Cytobacillus eiseniae TaxID=762947 RepID=A0ABS4R9B8_9BACI|nr:hypothetical protein [Cytobacillus eiseniae]MBP2239484.1 hypothetical protein [Cytobacillus eiseniae]